MTTHARILVFALALGAGLSCAPPVPAPVCSSANCPGCCDSQGQCQSGLEGTACGVSGSRCQVCERCILGVCGIDNFGGGFGGGGFGGGGFGGGVSSGGGQAGGVAGGEAGGSAGGAVMGGGVAGGGVATGGGNAGGGSAGGGSAGGVVAGGGSAGGGSAGGGSAACGLGLTSCASGCADLTADERNCGQCGRACGSGPVCSGSQCVSLPADCRQGAPCPGGYFCEGSTGRCEEGCNSNGQCPSMDCDLATHTCRCAPGQHRCASVCATDLDVQSCGLRCVACPGAPNGVATCDGTSCGVRCNPGFESCGGACAACPTTGVLQTGCAGSSCVAVACATGFHLCSGQCVSNTSVSSCGGSCSPCPTDPNGIAVCNGTTCGKQCNAGFRECQGTCSQCPTDPNGTATACSGSACVLAGCASGFHLCNGACVPNTATATCGSSCSPCPTDPNGTPTCDGFSCGFSCNANYRACQGACALCPSDPNASGTTCSGAQCIQVCAPGFHRCNGVCVSNGSTATCGSSCSPCPTDPNGVAGCNGTSCTLSCGTGYHACGSTCALNTSTSTCGNRCTPCATDPNGVTACDGTSCSLTCNSGFTSCGGICASCPTGPGVAGTTCQGTQCVATACNAGYRRCATGCCPWQIEVIEQVGRAFYANATSYFLLPAPHLALVNGSPVVAYGSVSSGQASFVGSGSKIRYAVRSTSGTWNISDVYGTTSTCVAGTEHLGDTDDRPWLVTTGTEAFIAFDKRDNEMTGASQLFLARGPVGGGTFTVEQAWAGNWITQASLFMNGSTPEIAFSHRLGTSDNRLAWVTKSFGWSTPENVFTYGLIGGLPYWHPIAGRTGGAPSIIYGHYGELLRASKSGATWSSSLLQGSPCTSSTGCGGADVSQTSNGLWMSASRFTNINGTEIIIKRVDSGASYPTAWRTQSNGPIVSAVDPTNFSNPLQAAYIEAGALKVVKANGAGVWESSTIATGIDPRGGLDIEVDSSGNPHVVYYSSSDYRLRYAH